MPPLITSMYTADPSAHAFGGRVYIYPSHDRESDIAFNDNGDQYDMTDYHVFSTAALGAGSDSSSDPPETPLDHGVVLRAADVPWVSKQMWAPDAAAGPDGRYYLYFPARDQAGVFRIGVAVADRPEGPFAPDPQPIPGSYSIDPAAFVDDDGAAYLFFGGLWGGQLQCYQAGGASTYDASWLGPREPSGPGARAMGPRAARLTKDMHRFEGDAAQEVLILAPETGEPIAADDHERRFFEAAWVHKRKGVYYFSYSTGDSHYLCYATSDQPLGPYTYRGRMLEPVLGWTTHHSVVEFKGRWYLFYHDCELSGGVDHLRSVKVKEIFYRGEEIVSQL